MNRFIYLVLAVLLLACKVPENNAKGDYPYVGGDLSGTTQDASVTGIQSKPVPSPAVGALQYDGGSYYWSTISSGGPGNTYGLYSSRSACTGGLTSQVFVPSDGPIQYACNGSTWQPLISGIVPGDLAEVAPASVSPFTFAYTSRASTVTVQGGTISLVAGPANGSDAGAPSSGVKLQTLDESYTPGHTVTAWISTLVMTNGRVGIYLSDSVLPLTFAHFAAYCFIAENGGQQQLELDNIYWNGSDAGSPTWTVSGTIGSGSPTVTFSNNQLVGLRMTGSGSNYNFYYSIDGVSWVLINAVTNMTSYVTPSHAGFFIDANGSANYLAATLLSWSNQ